MAYTSGSQGTVIDRFRLFSLAETIDPILLENFNGQWDLYMADLQSNGFSGKFHRSNSLTTPENPKASPEVPNAPMKPRKTTRRDDLPRRKLEFTEPEVEENSLDPGPAVLPVKTSNQNNLRTTKPEAKKIQINRNKSKNKLANCDKENDCGLANRTKNDKSSCQFHNTPKKSSKKSSKQENEFSHFRI